MYVRELPICHSAEIWVERRAERSEGRESTCSDDKDRRLANVDTKASAKGLAHISIREYTWKLIRAEGVGEYESQNKSGTGSLHLQDLSNAVAKKSMTDWSVGEVNSGGMKISSKI